MYFQDKPYLQSYLEEVRKELKEKEEWNSKWTQYRSYDAEARFTCDTRLLADCWFHMINVWLLSRAIFYHYQLLH